MVLTFLFENAEIDLSNKISQKLLHSDTYNKKGLRRMGYVKVEDQWICRESQIGTSNITKEEPKEDWISPNIPKIFEQAYNSIDEPSTSFNAINKTTNNTPTNPILTHDTLTKIIDSVVNISQGRTSKGNCQLHLD